MPPPTNYASRSATVADVTEPPFLSTTRAAYDTVAADYAEQFRKELESKPLDRGMLASFAELVRAAGVGPVADVGCGPGHVTAFLHSLGLTVRGIDLSPQMVAAARQKHPEVQFDEGSMTDLDLADGGLGGIVAWYSIIHTPPAILPGVLAEFHRVLGPGGYALLAFQVGNGCVRIEKGYGHVISLDAYRWVPDRVVDLLAQAGLDVAARLIREPDDTEKVPQAFLVARRSD
jgi:SAM-dependent methyltransferase